MWARQIEDDADRDQILQRAGSLLAHDLRITTHIQRGRILQEKAQHYQLLPGFSNRG
jgi:hypothetical protein